MIPRYDSSSLINSATRSRFSSLYSRETGLASYESVTLSLPTGYNLPAMVTRSIEFTFEEAVRTLGVTPDKLQKLIEEGRLKAVRDGIHTRIPRESILEYLHAVSAVPLKQRKG